MSPLDEELVKEIAFDEVKKLLVNLAIHFSRKTKFIAVPIGTTEWVVEKYNEHSSYPEKTIHIPLIHFFGMFVGYDSELDLLVMWDN